MQVLIHNITIFFYLISTIIYIVYLFKQKDYLQRLGFVLIGIGFAFNLIDIALLFYEKGFLLIYSFAGFLNVLACSLACVFIVLRIALRLKILGIAVSPFISFLIVLSGEYNLAPYEISSQFFKSIWIFIHVLLIAIGDSFFAIAFGLSILFLIQESSIKNKKTFFFFKRLPSLNTLEQTSFSCINIGFALLTFGLIIGIIYAKIKWGKFWSWDIKEICSGLAWFFYALIIHLRLISGFKGRKFAILTILAFIVLILTFLSANFILEGHHSNFTRF